MTPGSLRRTRVSSGIRAAFDRATRNDAVTAPQNAGPSPLGSDIRTTKYRQGGGARDGRWRDIQGRFTEPPSPRDEVISQTEARSRRASLATSTATAATDAARRSSSRTRDSTGKQHRERRSPSAKLSGTRTKKIEAIDRSWEKVTHADADAAAQAAAANAESADAGKPASMMADADAATQAASADANGAAAVAAAATNAAGSTRMQDDGTSGLRPAVAEDGNIRQDSVGAGALDTDAERSTISISACLGT